MDRIAVDDAHDRPVERRLRDGGKDESEQEDQRGEPPRERAHTATLSRPRGRRQLFETAAAATSAVDADEGVAQRVHLTRDVRLRATVASPALDRGRAVGGAPSLSEATVDDDTHVVFGRELLREIGEELRLATGHDEQV